MKMVCVVSREALKLMNGNRGKLAAQAGHAFLHAYWDAEERWSQLPGKTGRIPGSESSGLDYCLSFSNLYRLSGKAKKVTLVVETTAELTTLYDAYRPICGVSLVKDAGCTVFTEPTVTCLGIGPLTDDMCDEDLNSLKVLI